MSRPDASQPSPDGVLFAPLWSSARASWRKSDPRLYAVAPETPIQRPIDASPSYGGALARAIIHQQVSMAAGRAIHRRLLDACGGEWDAVAVRRLAEVELRAAGLSSAKARYVRALAEAELRGDLRDLASLADDEALVRLVALPGVGVWTARMFLIFHLQRLDVFSGEDLGLREGIRILDGLERAPAPAEAEQRAEFWRPYRSLAALVLWDVVARGRARSDGRKGERGQGK